MGKAFSWCIVILMGGTVYEVTMAYGFNKPTLWNFDFSMQMYGAILDDVRSLLFSNRISC
jgi:TRAP-type mannitol/chloroaromatic compound transport system permease small subunit